jgi:hypothetical protein
MLQIARAGWKHEGGFKEGWLRSTRVDGGPVEVGLRGGVILRLHDRVLVLFFEVSVPAIEVAGVV